MDIKSVPLDFDKVINQRINALWLSEKGIILDVLRLDLLHPVVSGNKWFKLKHYLQEAQQLNKSTIATFGGAFSNHIVATAFACKTLGLESIGIIRGERCETPSHTLQMAEEYGMQLIFVAREQYRQKDLVATEFSGFNWYWIGEGGYGTTGAQGAAEIMKLAGENAYSHILASVGTGTMLAGIIASAGENQKVYGFSSMKGNFDLEDNVRLLLPATAKKKQFTIFHDYHFGGYAKTTEELISFMNAVQYEHSLPLDFVYTGKLFYGIHDLITNNHFEQGARLLMIHSGGLQGNASREKHELSFL